VIVWRIHRRAYGVGLDGVGGRAASGRWNTRGPPIVYTAGTAALAVLERLVNIDPDLLPSDLVLTRIEIAEDVRVEDVRSRAKLPRRWHLMSHISLTRQFGMSWLSSLSSAVLQVPSAIVPEEDNFLLNPSHPDHARIRAKGSRGFRFDLRLFA